MANVWCTNVSFSDENVCTANVIDVCTTNVFLTFVSQMFLTFVSQMFFDVCTANVLTFVPQMFFEHQTFVLEIFLKNTRLYQTRMMYFL